MSTSLQHADPEVRIAAARSLQSLDLCTIESLSALALLTDVELPRVKKCALKAFSSIARAEAPSLLATIPAICEMATGDDFRDRIRAVQIAACLRAPFPDLLAAVIGRLRDRVRIKD